MEGNETNYGPLERDRETVMNGEIIKHMHGREEGMMNSA
jgi:hypothetical protein